MLPGFTSSQGLIIPDNPLSALQSIQQTTYCTTVCYVCSIKRYQCPGTSVMIHPPQQPSHWFPFSRCHTHTDTMLCHWGGHSLRHTLYCSVGLSVQLTCFLLFQVSGYQSLTHLSAPHQPANLPRRPWPTTAIASCPLHRHDNEGAAAGAPARLETLQTGETVSWPASALAVAPLTSGYTTMRRRAGTDQGRVDTGRNGGNSVR